MKPIDITFIDALRGAARAASLQAYCPHSRFPVGAAVLTEDDRIYAGCNVENASFGLTICAERNAIFQAIAAGKRTIRAVVVFTPTQSPTAPCGACRQVINEFGPLAVIRSYCETDSSLDGTTESLLPAAFGPHNLSS